MPKSDNEGEVTCRKTKPIRRIAIIGTGVIGASWSSLFLAKGLQVVATDIAPNAEAALRKFVETAWPALKRLGLSPGASQSNLTFTADLAQALAGADLVQENGPERIDFKQKLYGQLDELLPPDVIIASSSSGLTMSEIQKGAASHPERCVIAHPFNPPHLIPLVEIVGGAKTSEATIRRAAEFYTSIGQRTVRLNKEMPGHVANRLQAALAREVYYLVAEGVVSAADVDTALSWGPGLRWGVMGGLMLNHLGGGPGGIEHFFQQFTGPMTAWWKTLGSPVLTPEVQKKLIDSVHAEAGSRTIERTGGGARRSPARPDRAAQTGRKSKISETERAGSLDLTTDPIKAPKGTRLSGLFHFETRRSVIRQEGKNVPRPQAASRTLSASASNWSSRSHASLKETYMTTATAARKTDAPKPLPAPEQRLLSARRGPDPRGTGGGEEGARVHGDQGPADHQQVLVRGRVSVRAAARRSRSWHRRARLRGLRLRRRQPEAVRLRRHGDGAHRRVDRTFFGVHSGLAMGSIYLDGSEEQKQKWLPPMARLEKIGCFGLTEPLVGSGASGGLTTTAKREGDTWILNGQKRWIGNAPWCDVSIIWARDVADNQVKGFIVENKTTPGFSVEKIENKIALKVVQNGQITLKDVPRAGSEPAAGRQFVPRYRAGAADDAIHGRLGVDRHPDGRLRSNAQIRPGATAVRQADRLVPAGAGPARQDARQRHGVPVHDGAPGAAGRRRQARRPPCGAREGVLHGEDRARRSPGAASCWAATASSPTTTSRASSPMPRRSTPTKARIRCRT